jgi:hypothetical protein
LLNQFLTTHSNLSIPTEWYDTCDVTLFFRSTKTTRKKQAKMMTVGWHNVSPMSNQWGIFCHNISLFIRVGEFVAINVGENCKQLGRVMDISQTRNYDILRYFPDTNHYIGPFLKINHFNVIKELAELWARRYCSEPQLR